MSSAANQGTVVGTDAQAPRARMPKNGPLGFRFTLSENTEPTPASTASTPTSHHEWRWLTDRKMPTPTPLSRTSAACAWWTRRSWWGSDRPYIPVRAPKTA